MKCTSAAKTKAEAVVRDLAAGSQAAVLSAPQSREALAALQRAQDFYKETGRRVSISTAFSDYFDALKRLNGHSLDEAVEGFLRNVATVKRKGIKAAVEEFIQADEPRTKAREGERPQLAPKFFYNRKLQLSRFAAMFPNIAVCDLTKELLGKFIESLSEPMNSCDAQSRLCHRHRPPSDDNPPCPKLAAFGSTDWPAYRSRCCWLVKG